MDLLIKIFGEGKDLNVWQMTCRGIAMFLVAFLLIRISGRRSFGVRTPLDNIILILLGAILSRAVVGASPVVPVVVSCLAIVLLHRLFGFFTARSRSFDQLAQGKKFLLFDNGRFNKRNMRRALVRDEDVMQGVRSTALTEDMDKIDKVYMERNGQITAVKKNP